MISSLFDTIGTTIDNLGGLLAWIFIGAVLFYGLRSNNGGSRGGSSKSGGGSAS